MSSNSEHLIDWKSVAYTVLNELHHNSRREEVTGGASSTTRILVSELVCYKGWTKAKARRTLKSMTDAGLLAKLGKRGRATTWTWTGDGIGTFFTTRKAKWAADAKEGWSLAINAAPEAYDAANKAGGVLVAKKDFVLGDMLRVQFLDGTIADLVLPTTPSVGDQDKRFVDVRTVPLCKRCDTAQLTSGPCQHCLVQLEELEARTFKDRGTYCSLCLDEVDPWSGDEGYTACCNKRMCEVNEASERNDREIKQLKEELQ